MPQGGEYNPFPVARRVNSAHTMLMDGDLEDGNLGPYQDRPRTFPNMRSKAYTPLVRIIATILFHVVILVKTHSFSLFSFLNASCVFICCCRCCKVLVFLFCFHVLSWANVIKSSAFKIFGLFGGTFVVLVHFFFLASGCF